MKIKRLLNCEVYDENATLLGKTRDVTFDKSTGKCLLNVDETVYAVDNMSVTQKRITASNLQKTETRGATLLDKPVYDTTGKLLGNIVNASLGKNVTLFAVYCDNGERYARGRIAAANDIVIIKANQPAKTATAVQNPHKNICATKQEQTTISLTPANTQYPVRRRYGDFSFLLGKTVDKNITNFFNEVMIRAGEVVTYKTLRQAKMSGKLIELCLHAKYK